MRRDKSLVIGLACGLGCMICVGLYAGMVDREAAAARADMLAEYGGDQVEVCIARRDLAAGETIEDSQVETKMWVSALLPEGAVTERNDAVGRQLATSVLKGEVISSRRFGSSASVLDVPEGLAAVSVPSRDVQAVGGALSAGMRVDVYATGASSTTKLASRVPVVATSAGEAGLSDFSGSMAWVTLAVPPESVEEMVSAAQNLELYFVLPAEGGASEDGLAADSDDGDAAAGSTGDAKGERG